MIESKKALKIIVMSDTHSLHNEISISKMPKGDIFIHSGDFTKISKK
jgi:predicted phosphodiesterase